VGVNEGTGVGVKVGVGSGVVVGSLVGVGVAILVAGDSNTGTVESAGGFLFDRSRRAYGFSTKMQTLSSS